MMKDDRTNCPSCYNPLLVTLDYSPYHIDQLGASDYVPRGVNAATCYLLDAQGNVVDRMTATDAALLKKTDYTFVFDDLMPGTYRVLTVAAQQPMGGSALTRPSVTELATGDNVSRMQVRVPRADTPDADGRYAVDCSQPLDSVWLMMTMAQADHRRADSLLLGEREPVQVYAEKMRLTNNLNISLIQLENPADNGAERYDVRVIDHNGLLDYQAEPIENTPLVYTPYAAWTAETTEEEGTAPTRAAVPAAVPAAFSGETAPTRAAGDVIARTAHYDLSLCRLISHSLSADNARLIVTNREDGQTILDIDLIHYLLLMRNAFENTISPQRFLDVQDDFRFSIVLAGNQWRYMDISINVLAWSLRIQNVDL